ncbi:hypothetical protein [Actinoplanes sp. NPDC020271]|uniref:hypothetical protein n=1 Tax=Actinoplanes sp. NPDC020271 TaxID=3363896 RepID=UPI00378FCD94
MLENWPAGLTFSVSALLVLALVRVIVFVVALIAHVRWKVRAVDIQRIIDACFSISAMGVLRRSGRRADPAAQEELPPGA